MWDKALENFQEKLKEQQDEMIDLKSRSEDRSRSPSETRNSFNR